MDVSDLEVCPYLRILNIICSIYVCIEIKIIITAAMYNTSINFLNYLFVLIRKI